MHAGSRADARLAGVDNDDIHVALTAGDIEDAVAHFTHHGFDENLTRVHPR